MTVYFTASIVGKKQYLPNYLKIIDTLRSKGYEVISDHIIGTTESQIRMEKMEERIKFQQQLVKWINSSVFIVAETSFPSISVGYEISLAQHLGKPILVLYSSENPPSLLAHHKDESLICENYTFGTLGKTIDRFISFVKDSNDVKFTFFITSEMSAYLDKISVSEKIPKSVYIRKLIQQEMKTAK